MSKKPVSSSYADVSALSVRLTEIGAGALPLTITLSSSDATDLLQGEAGVALPCQIVGVVDLSLRLAPEGLGEAGAEVIKVSGRLKVPLTVPCRRCLAPSHHVVDSEVRWVLVPKGQEPLADAQGELQADDLAVATYEQGRVELHGLVRDEILLDVPLLPLCGEECRGLCNQCGVDLNEGLCECKKAIDPRWADLLKIEFKKDD